MSQLTINQAIGEVHQEEQSEQDQFVQEQPVQQDRFDWWEFIKTPTGEGDLMNYTNHPLNFDGSKATGRILRGLTGFVGNLDFALADIVIGILEFTKRKNNVTANGN